MKKIFFAMMIFVINHANAQDQKIANLANLIADIGNLDAKFQSNIALDKRGELSPFVFNKFIENKFTYLTFNRGDLPSTNSASLDISDNSTKLKLAFAKKFVDGDERIKAIVSAGVQTKLGDGIAEIFKGNSATSGTTIFLNGALLNKFLFSSVTRTIMNGVSARPADLVSLDKKINKYKKIFDDKYITEFSAKYTALINRYNSIGQDIHHAAIPGNDSTGEKIVLLYKEKEQVEKDLNEMGLIDGSTDNVAKAIEEKFQSGYYEVITKAPAWNYYRLSWTSFGITYTRNSYVTYDNTLALNNRFGSKDFDAMGFKVTQNWFYKKEKNTSLINSWYLGISYQPSLTNSFDDISPKDITKNVTAANSVDTSFIFQTVKKARDISGKPFATSWQHSLSAAYTAMLFKKGNIGLNLLFLTKLSSITKPIFNSRIGAIFSMANSDYDSEDKKSKTKVNFEFFMEFADMTDTGISGKSVWQNRTIGISTNIPFNKIFFK